MGALLSRVIRRQQPQQLLAIDWSNPIARGLAIAVNGATPNVNVATGTPMSAMNGGLRLVGKDGVGLAFSSTASAGAQVATSSVLSGSAGDFKGGVTVLVLANPSASTTRFLPFCTAQAAQPEWYFQFNANKSLTATSGMFSVQTQGANGATFAGAVDGKTHLFAVVFPDGSTAPRLYVDGVDGTTSATPATNGLLSAANAQDYVGGYKSSGYATTGFCQYLTLAFNRALTPSEIRSLAANPWQLFKPRPRRLWLAFSAAGGITTNVNPGAGALALAGYAPAIARSANQTVAPGAAAVTMAGYAPTVTQSSTTSVAPLPGTLTLAGFAPTVAQSASRSVSLGAGTISLAGYAPTVTRTASQAVQPSSGALMLTGYAPLIFQGVDNAPRVNVTTIMRITTTNRIAGLGTALNAVAPIRSTDPAVATIMDAAPVNRTADLGPASINRTASFP